MNTTTRRQQSDTTRRSWAHRHRPALLFALISGAVLALLFLTRGDNVMAQDDKREEFLAAHIWEHRVVLVLGDDEEDSTFYTKQLEAFDEPVGGGQVKDIAVVVSQGHVQPRVGQGHAGELLGDVTEFGGGSLEKLAARQYPHPG